MCVIYVYILGLLLPSPTLISSLFVYLVIQKSVLNIDSSDSLVDKLTLFSDLID